MTAIRKQWLSAGTGVGRMNDELRREALVQLGWTRKPAAVEPDAEEPMHGEWWTPPNGTLPRMSLRRAAVLAAVATAEQGFTLGSTLYCARATGGRYYDRMIFQIVVRNGLGAVVECCPMITELDGTPRSALNSYVERVRADYRREYA